jgi:two-component system, LytTR family, sensor kinase
LLKNIYNRQRHIIFWVIYIGYAEIYQKIVYPNDAYPILAWVLQYVSYIILFYFTYAATFQYLKNKKRLNFWPFLFIILGFFAVFGFQIIKDYYVLGNKSLIISYYYMLFGEIFFINTFAVFFALFEFTEQLNLLIYKNLHDKNEKTLLYNRAKRNKGRLIKILDNIIAENKTLEIKEDLTKFRDLVNFLINSTHKALISIVIEIENVQKYLDLYHLRIGKDEIFKVNIIGEPTDWQIPHKTILTLIENTIKHGDLNLPIFINIYFEPSELKIQMRNKKKTIPDHFLSSNIGLKNLKARFKLHLPNRHTIEIIEDGCWFEVWVLVY